MGVRFEILTNHTADESTGNVSLRGCRLDSLRLGITFKIEVRASLYDGGSVSKNFFFSWHPCLFLLMFPFGVPLHLIRCSRCSPFFGSTSFFMAIQLSKCWPPTSSENYPSFSMLANKHDKVGDTVDKSRPTSRNSFVSLNWASSVTNNPIFLLHRLFGATQLTFSEYMTSMQLPPLTSRKVFMSNWKLKTMSRILLNVLQYLLCCKKTRTTNL